MAKAVENVRVYGDIDSAVYVGDKGATPPTDAVAAPGAAFTELGWLGDDGLTETRDVSADQKRAWQGGALVRTVRSSDTRKFKCVAWETTATVMALTRPGSEVTTTAGVTHTKVKAFTGSDIRSWIIDQKDGDINVRKIVAQGEVVEMGDIVSKNGELVAYELTIECYPASDGTLYEEYSDDPAVAIAP